MIRFILLITLLPALALGDDWNLRECEGVPLPTDFSIDECPNGRPCKFDIDKTIHVKGTIKIDHPVTKLPSVVEAIKPNGETINFGIPSGDACNAVVEAKCPLDPGTYTIYSPVVIKGTPGEAVTTRIVIRDQDNKVVGCASTDTQFH
ncbi:uncharacterized protein LOC129796601 [Lutzomyia longipalpis]|uniref:uncharacterized protein LOC129796601 n=1 Tax=Lutzomyia longipalpis TaxID=7200 RepID=UPI00248346B8|nr:uncharacterized protein LOC129796601 [Lutzomyia longipalpis]